jgi:hypothetical protein
MFVTVDANSLVVSVEHTESTQTVRELAFKVRANLLGLKDAERILEKKYEGNEHRRRIAVAGLRLLADW